MRDGSYCFLALLKFQGKPAGVITHIISQEKMG